MGVEVEEVLEDKFIHVDLLRLVRGQAGEVQSLFHQFPIVLVLSEQFRNAEKSDKLYSGNLFRGFLC